MFLDKTFQCGFVCVFDGVDITDIHAFCAKFYGDSGVALSFYLGDYVLIATGQISHCGFALNTTCGVRI